MPTLLLFNIAPPKRAKMQVIALRCACRMQVVPPERHGAKLEEILSGSAGETGEPAFSEELLVMSGLGERQMDVLLTELRRQRIPIALKAVVTPTNAGWTAAELYTELCREREAFAAGRQVHT